MNVRAAITAMVIVIGFMLISMAIVSSEAQGGRPFDDTCFNACLRKCEETTPYTLCIEKCSENLQCPPPVGL